MEFNEILQELRKQKGLTQEELASALYVSRTAVSKWESGRGYPNIDSLKEISAFFSVSIDMLLSGDELLTLAEEDNRQRENHLYDLVFGFLDLSTAVLFFLPFFGQRTEGWIQAVSLLMLEETAAYMKLAYYGGVIGLVLSGVLRLAFQNISPKVWLRYKNRGSFWINVVGILLFVMGQQPYAACYLFVSLLIKVLLLIKKQ